MLEELVKNGTVKKFRGGSERVYVHKEYYMRLLSQAASILKQYHLRYPLKSGMPVEEFRNRIFGRRKGSFIDGIIRAMEHEGAIKIKPHAVSLPDFSIELTSRHREIRDYLLKLLERGGYSPPGPVEIINSVPYREDEVNEVLDMLTEAGEVKRTGSDDVFLIEYYDRAVEIAVAHIKKEGGISLGTFRDLLNTSRKYAMALLEEMDRDRITKRVGDERILYR